MAEGEKLPPAGWYDDKSGRKRWWDGQQWGKLTPEHQTKTCPNCGQNVPLLGEKCPACGKRYKKRTVLMVWILIVVVGLASLGGCAALVAVELNNEEKRAEKKAITWEQFNSVPLGISEEKLRSTLPVEPAYAEEESWQSMRGGPEKDLLCLRYYRKDDTWEFFRFCFEDDRLKSKDLW